MEATTSSESKLILHQFLSNLEPTTSVPDSKPGPQSLIFDYFYHVVEANNVVEAVCKTCSSKLRGNRGVTSNFVTHLKRRHLNVFIDFLKRKGVFRLPEEGGTPKRQTTATPAAAFVDPLQSLMMGPSDLSQPRSVGSTNELRQLQVHHAIFRMLIKDILPMRMLYGEGFLELMVLLDPWYLPVNFDNFQASGLRDLVAGAEEEVLTLLQENMNVGVAVCKTFSINNQGIFVLTWCSFITYDWQPTSVLLSCKHSTSNRQEFQLISQGNLLNHVKAILSKYRITNKITRIILDTDGAIERSADENDESNHVSTSSSRLGDQSTSSSPGCLDSVADSSSSSKLPFLPNFAGALQSAVGRGWNAVMSREAGSLNLTSFLEQTIARLHDQDNEMQREPFETVVKCIQYVMTCDATDPVAALKEGLDSEQKVALMELVEILEPFQEAFDLLTPDKHVPLSLALPSYLGLVKHLTDFKPLFFKQLVTIIKNQLRSMDHLNREKDFIVSAVLDPKFKLKWCSGFQATQFRDMLVSEVESIGGDCDVKFQPSQTEGEPPIKRSKLFSFMDAGPSLRRLQSSEQEVEAYLLKNVELNFDDPLSFWRKHCAEYPTLAILAKRTLAIPANRMNVHQLNEEVKTIVQNLQPVSPKITEQIAFLRSNVFLL